MTDVELLSAAAGCGFAFGLCLITWLALGPF